MNTPNEWARTALASLLKRLMRQAASELRSDAMRSLEAAKRLEGLR